MMTYCTRRQAGDGDVWDATALKLRPAEEWAIRVYLKVTCDGTVFSTCRSKSFTEIAAEVLNIHPRIRTTCPAWIIVAVLPAKCSVIVHHNLIKDIIAPIKIHLVGSDTLTAFEVEDFFTGTRKHLTIELVMLVSYSMGIQDSINSRRQPSVEGGCPLCYVKGIRGQLTASTYYPSAIVSTDPQNPVRNRISASVDRNRPGAKKDLCDSFLNMKTGKPHISVTLRVRELVCEKVTSDLEGIMFLMTNFLQWTGFSPM